MSSIDALYEQQGVGPRAHVFDSNRSGRQSINPPSLFDSRSLFSQIIVAPRGRSVWISGLIGCTSDNRLVAGGKAAQIEQAFANLRAAIAAAGCRPEHCARITEYIVDYEQNDIALLKLSIESLFPAGQLPTNVLVPVQRLGRDLALFEIDACCVLPDAV